ncbi:MAG: hypothetical protein VW169_07290, partial [Rhodospirillaceae bacterium]
IISELNQSGFIDYKTAPWKEKSETTVKRHGFDISKLHAASLFFLPCQTKRDGESFFVDFAGNELDPDLWAKVAPEPEIEPESQVNNTTAEIAVRDIQHVVQRYRSIPPNLGRRNAGYFKLGCDLHRMGLNRSEIILHLEQADYDGSRRKKNAIKSVLRSLDTGRYT